MNIYFGKKIQMRWEENENEEIVAISICRKVNDNGIHKLEAIKTVELPEDAAEEEKLIEKLNREAYEMDHAAAEAAADETRPEKAERNANGKFVVKNQIKTIRKRNGLNQTEFAKRIGISRVAVSDMERQAYQPDAATIFAICYEFDCSFNQVIVDESQFVDYDDI